MVSYEVIGQHIHDARLRLGLTQAEAAELAGISAAYYGKIERGVIKPNIDRLADISQALRIPFESIFKGAVISEAVSLDNQALPYEEFDEYIHALSPKLDHRGKLILMNIGEILSDPAHNKHP